MIVWIVAALGVAAVALALGVVVWSLIPPAAPHHAARRRMVRRCTHEGKPYCVKCGMQR